MKRLWQRYMLWMIVFMCLSLLEAVLSFFHIPAQAANPRNVVAEYRPVVEKSIRHDMSAYTQGLFIEDGVMYESTGQYGQSSFRKVDLATGKVLENIPFPHEYFLEGSCVHDGMIYILTWFEEVCFVYDMVSLGKVAEFPYKGQGWGLTTDGRSLIMSDGSDKLSYRDPMTFAVQKTVHVRYNGKPVHAINELEYIDGLIWANIYNTDWIYQIDPETGNVVARIDCSGLLEQQYRTSSVDVLNGIAYDKENDSVYLTGKYWPRMYKVSLKAL